MDSVLKLPDVTADVLQLLIFFNKLTSCLNIESSHFLLSDWSIPTGSNSNKEVGSRAGAC